MLVRELRTSLRMVRAVAVVAAIMVLSAVAEARPRHPRISRLSRLTVGTRVDAVSPRVREPAPPPSPRELVREPPPEPAVLAPPTATTTATTPPSLRLTDAPPAPPRRWGQVAGGVVLFLAGYGADLGLSYGLGANVQRPWLAALPLVGPLAQMGESWSVVTPSQSGNAQVDAEANARIAEVNRAAQTAAYVVLAVDFALQLAGLTMAIVGALPPRGARAADVTIAPSATGRAALSLSF